MKLIGFFYRKSLMNTFKGDNMIKLDGVNKKYKNQEVLHDIKLNIKGVFGLLGPNGAGKSTLLEILATALEKDSGNITYEQLSWDNPHLIRNKIGFVPQFFDFYDQVTVQEFMLYFSSLKNIKNSKREIEEIIQKVNLDTVRNKKIKSLSGGMLRRLSIAQALLGDPEILIVDEPTTGLDMTERNRFRKILKLEGNHKIVIISSHIAEDLEFMCDNYAILNNGHLLTTGTKQEIISKVPKSVYEVEIPFQKLNVLLQSYDVMKFDELENNMYKVRLLQKPEQGNYVKVEPTLEEAYIILIQKEMVKANE